MCTETTAAVHHGLRSGVCQLQESSGWDIPGGSATPLATNLMSNSSSGGRRIAAQAAFVITCSRASHHVPLSGTPFHSNEPQGLCVH